MKKIDRHQTKLHLVLHHEVVLHLSREQLVQARVGGASGKTQCEGCRVDGAPTLSFH